MTKQEFLAISLPYTLKCLGRRKDSKIHTILSCYFGYNIILKVEAPNYIDYTWHICDVKPILHPLSDLTKQIEHKGEKFTPLIELMKPYFDLSCGTIRVIGNSILFDGDVLMNLEIINLTIDKWLKLIEWHFDVADLISKEEAIDVNTLEINPYK